MRIAALRRSLRPTAHGGTRSTHMGTRSTHGGTRSTHMGYSEYSHVCADHCRRRHTRRRLHGQASSSGAIIPIRIFHTHTHREAHRGAARHNKGMSRADENHRACILGRGGGSGRASAMPCPDRRMAGPPPLLGLACTHAAWHWPGSGIPSRSVASAALHTLTVGFIGSCHSLARFSFWFCSM